MVDNFGVNEGTGTQFAAKQAAGGEKHPKHIVEGILASGQPGPVGVDDGQRLTVNSQLAGTFVESGVSISTDAEILAANANAIYRFIQNQSTTIFLRLACDGTTALDDSTCSLLGPGDSREFKGDTLVKSAIRGLGVGGACPVHFEEITAS